MNTSEWITEFETRYAQAKREKAFVRKKTAEARKNKPVKPDNQPPKPNKKKNTEYADRAIKHRKDEARMIRERLTEGYVFGFERDVAGRVRKPFTEHGLRSERYPLLKLFVARVPKGGKARASDNKAELYVPYKSKLLTLDCPYIETNKTMVGHIRIDIDGIFASPEHFEAEVQKLVDSGKLPHAPHSATGDLLADGRFAKPHVLFMLPSNSEVWINREDERCRQHPISLLDSVTRGLTKAMLPLGADPDAPRLTQRMKNPLSPIWHVIIMNDTQFLTLREYVRKLDVSKSWEHLARQAAVVQSNLGVKASNKLFNEAKELAKKIARGWHFSCDPRIKSGKDKLAQHLFDELEKQTPKTASGAKEREYVFEKVSGYISSNFDPRKLENPNKNRGAAMHKVDGIKTVSGRQRIGAQHALEERKRKAAELVEAFLIAYDEAKKNGKVSIEAVAKSVKIPRASAYRALKERQHTCLPWCIDKKVPLGTPVEEEINITDDEVEIQETTDTSLAELYDYDLDACEDVYISSQNQCYVACNMPADIAESTYR